MCRHFQGDRYWFSHKTISQNLQAYFVGFSQSWKPMNLAFFIFWGSFPLFLLQAHSLHELQCTSHSSAIFFTSPFFRYLLVTISLDMVSLLSVGIDIFSWMLYNLESNDKIHSEGTCMEKYEVALLNLTEN